MELQDTQREVVELSKKACDLFDTYQDYCTALIDEYAPLAFNLLEAYLQPDSLCLQLGYCPPSPPVAKFL